MVVAAGLALATLGTVAPVSGAAAQDGSTIGTAKATALVLKVAPTVGALELALGSGISVAEVRNQVAQSQSQSLDLGLIGSALTAQKCNGDDASFRPNDLPQPLRIDNREGDASAQDAAAPISGSDLSGGLQEVRATTQPLSEAVSTSSSIRFGDLLSVGGGRAVATTEVLDGTTRIAHATVNASVDIAGIVQLDDLRWEALHRTGSEPDAFAGFEIGSATVLGVPVQTEGVPIEDVLATANAALGPLGVTILPPTVERFTEPADVVRVTPMRVRYGDSPLSALLFAAALDASRQLRDDLAAAVIDIECQTSTLFLLAEIGIGNAAGTGSTVIDVGGAEATTGLVALENPFGDGALLPPAEDLPALAPAPSGETGGAPAVAGTPPVVIDGTPPGGSPLAVQPVGSFERVCESVHPFRWPSCSAGAAPFVGIVAIAATAALAFLDWRHQRRRARTAEVPA